MNELVCIAALGENRVIGAKNAIPWHLSADLKRFKALTLDHPILMGRKTFESLGSKPLPRRRNLVVSGTPQQGVETFATWEAALAACADAPRVFVIGGALLYAAALASGLVTRLELTRVALSPEGDTFFPPFERSFVLASAESFTENGVAFRYESWVRPRSVSPESDR